MTVAYAAYLVTTVCNHYSENIDLGEETSEMIARYILWKIRKTGKNYFRRLHSSLSINQLEKMPLTERINRIYLI